MIDTRDLPPAVQRAVAQLPAADTATESAARLRSMAASCWYACQGIWPTGQWHQVHEQLGLCGAFLTAAQRIEEEGPG